MDTDSENHTQDKPILLFDGSCGLCSGIVQFLLRLRRGEQFTYIPLKSPRGRYLSSKFSGPTIEDDTVVIIHERIVHKKSDAVIFVLEYLGGLWRVAAWVRVVPRWLRDRLYDFVAKNRKTWFGTSKSCLIPPLGEGSYVEKNDPA